MDADLPLLSALLPWADGVTTASLPVAALLTGGSSAIEIAALGTMAAGLALTFINLKIGRINDIVAYCPCATTWIAFPDRRWLASRQYRYPRDQTSENTVTDYQVSEPPTRNSMIGGRREREQHGFFSQRFADWDGAACGDDDAASRATEQAFRIAVATRAGHEDSLAHPQPSIGPRIDDAANRFVSGNQRITHAREGGHPPGPEQTLGPGTDAAIFDFDENIVTSKGA